MDNLYKIAYSYSKKRILIKNSHNGKAKLFCLIGKLKKNNIYSCGINKYNIDNNFGSIHAEVDACNKLKYSKKNIKVDILILRTNNKGDKLLNSKPCLNCLNYIKRNLNLKNYKFSRIYFTDNDKINFIKSTIII